MKIVVAFKWIKNPEDARVGADGSMDWRAAKMAPSDDDPLASEIAKGLAADGDEIVGLTIGDGDAAWAAARGASSTVIVTDAAADADAAVTGAVLAAAIRHIGDVDVVLVGDSAWDYGVSAALAGRLGSTALAGVSSVTREGDRLRATRKLGDVNQVVEVAMPAVLAVSASRKEENPPGMKEVLMARKKPQTKLTLADLGIEARSSVTSQGTRLPDTPPARIIDGADPAAAVAELTQALRADGVL
ncbi:MAG: electron transfer flavoprotein subunit alpha [Deltaproteobacteria bacterium HGW-Deltaproteobacteria-20]|nr:MAG: electron transfer flavoprotein subunit alpha [Deltaproteobacteria bacterium HGW-Deltaproteobacteria-20]